MVAERVEVEEVGDVDVLHAELIRFAAVVNAARLIVVDLDPLHFEANVAVLHPPIELRVAVDEVDGRDVMGDERQNFLFRFLIDDRRAVRIVVLKEVKKLMMVPGKCRKLTSGMDSRMCRQISGSVWMYSEQVLRS